jgi:carbon monoxide dehydrogenase subunit G
MTIVSQNVTVDRPVEEVWAFISNFENTTPMVSGRAGGEADLRRPPRCRLVTEYEPNRAFAFKVTSGPVTSRARFSVEPAGAGTRLTASGEAEAAGRYQLLAPILVRTLKRHSQDDLARVKRILEAPVPAS